MPHFYGITDEENAFVAAATQIATTTLREYANAVDGEARFPREGIEALRKAGLLGLAVDTAHGGAGQGLRAFAGVVDELATGCASTAMVYVMHVCGAQSIASSSTLTDRDALLRDIAAGKHLSTLALSEAGSRSNFWAPVSQLRADGNGFKVSAKKSWVTSASEADSYVSSAQRPGAASPLESTGYLVRKGAAGARITARFDGLGLRGNDSAPVELTDLALRAGDLLTEQGAGAKLKLEVVLPWFAVGTSAMAHGVARAALGSTIAHLQSAGLEHTGQKLRDLPNLRERVARMSTKIDASRALLGHTLAEIYAGNPAAPLYVLEGRLSALETAVEVTDLAMKTCGGAAFSRHLTVERNFRDARAGWVMAPTVDHLVDFAGKALTGLPLF